MYVHVYTHADIDVRLATSNSVVMEDADVLTNVHNF